MSNLAQLLYIDNLSLIMMALIGFVGLTVASFSFSYLKGDRKQKAYYFNLILLVSSVFLMSCADHLLLLFLASITSNFFLTRLMLHKHEWYPARKSSELALKNFAAGLVFLGSGLLGLYYLTKKTSIQAILTIDIHQNWKHLIACFIFLSAMTQSAIWPFHRWLTSSLNSPTPVSAVMHAGLINGGGFILTRFAPIFLESPLLLHIIFVIGIMTALLGTLWKLMQTDIKRMLACSTMGQMGFMIAQCGLGLFPAAIAHLCWHGLFKAYLFLSSSSAAQEKRLDLQYPPSMSHFLWALICGVCGVCLFSLSSGKNISTIDTNLFLTMLAMVSGAQFALPLIRSDLAIKIPLALGATTLMGGIYGLIVYFMELALSPLDIVRPQPLNIFHIIAFISLTAAWLAIIFIRRPINRKQYPDWMLACYVRMLNASQPHPKTVTTYRNEYQF